jgi:drug/metabolite transporter (DMT)-like permease
MAVGTLFALAAGLMWGLIFVGPLLLPEYPAALQSVGRYLAFGLIALPLAWFDRGALRQLGRADWLVALKLAAIGNLIYYLCVASAIQRAGGPLPTVIIGTLPVTIAVTANLSDSQRDTKLPWLRLAPALMLIIIGMAFVNNVEIAALRSDVGADLTRYAQGALIAFGAVACWTWYPLRNAAWLREHPGRSPRAWATAQGVATLPLAVIGYVLLWGGLRLSGNDFAMPAGPRPFVFIGIMAAIGLFASWLGTLCWNEASRRLSTTVAGQLIVFETLAGLTYSFIQRHKIPEFQVVIGIALLIAGVILALRAKPKTSSAV